LVNKVKNKILPHESAIKHVSGESVYIDDIQTDDRLLTGRVVYSPYAHARIKAVNLSAAKALPGVWTILNYKDIRGVNQMGPVFKDEFCLAEDKVIFIGQAICLIAAENEDICRQAEKLIKIEFESLPAILSIEEAQIKKQMFGETYKIQRGNLNKAFKASSNIIKGQIATGAQEHWYLETQVCLCIPGEGHEIDVYSSTQHPAETQALIADVLGISRNEVVVEVRRMGGAFGGKETQANHTACWTALLCQASGRPVKLRLSRDDDQKITGKRHPYLIKYKVGFGKKGHLNAAKFEMNSNGGAAVDLSFAILERAMFHVDNAYYIPNLSVTGRVWKTNIPPNTALRGFGAPQKLESKIFMVLKDEILRIMVRLLNIITFQKYSGK
jgi:xanthine dehydrogenase molybdopterin-binding subunit B